MRFQTHRKSKLNNKRGYSNFFTPLLCHRKTSMFNHHWKDEEPIYIRWGYQNDHDLHINMLGSPKGF